MTPPACRSSGVTSDPPYLAPRVRSGPAGPVPGNHDGYPLRADGVGLISKIFSATAGEVADKVAGIADRFMQTPDEKAGFRLQVEQLLQQRDSEVEQTIRDTVNARMQVTVAELHQGDNYTKRARPTVVYFGLLVIFYNYCLIPTVQLIHGADLQPFALPSEFWMAWGGVVATWSIGRDANRVIPRSRIAANLAGTRAEPAEGYL